MFTQGRTPATMNQNFAAQGRGRGVLPLINQSAQLQPGNPTYNQQQNVAQGFPQQQQQQNIQPVQQKPAQVQQKLPQQLFQQKPPQVQQNIPTTTAAAAAPKVFTQPPALTLIQPDESIPLPEETSNQDSDVTMDSSAAEQPKWKRKKIPGVKVNRKLKRLRMDQRLKKTLMPKNAIMVLNEMKSGVQFVFPDIPTQSSLFLVHAQLDGKTYVGQGMSKPLARQNAAENALKCLVLEKMEAAAKLREEAEKNKKQQLKTEGLVSETTGLLSDTNKVSIGENENGETMMDCINGGGDDEKDDIPWRALANFALYKLLNEWQNQGTVVMMPKTGLTNLQLNKPEVKQPAVKELPDNPEKIHPVMLLNQMRPGIVYNELGRSGNPPNFLFTLSVETDGKTFTGTAKNKKEAKKHAAINALKEIYGVNYPVDNTDKNTETMDFTVLNTNNKILEGFVPQQEQHNLFSQQNAI